MAWPLALALAPHGAISLDDKLFVTAPGAAGAMVTVSILADCDGDGVPDPALSKGGCKSPLATKQVQLNAAGTAIGPFSLAELPEVKAAYDAAGGAPTLGVMVAKAAGDMGEVERVWFGGGDACTPFKPLLAGFGAACDPAFVSILWSPRELKTDLAGTFMVYRAKADSDNPGGEAVPGTLGATGVTWEDAEHLLVTRGESGGRGAGLFRVDLEGEGEQLMTAEAGHSFWAPRSLGKDGLAYVDRAPEGDRLVLVQKGKVKYSVPLPRPAETILGWDGATFLVYSTAPTYSILAVHPKTGVVEDLGWAASVYASLTKGSAGTSAVTYRDDAKGFGWEIAIVDSAGKTVHDLRVDEDGTDPGLDDRSPAWRPGKNEVAWVGEVR